MFTIIGLWILFGVLIQVIGGVIEGYKVDKLEQETGKKYDDRYNSIFLLRIAYKVMPLSRYAVQEYRAKGHLTLGFCVVGVINNLWGYTIWPIYFPMMMLAYDEAHKAFLNDNKEEF